MFLDYLGYVGLIFILHLVGNTLFHEVLAITICTPSLLDYTRNDSDTHIFATSLHLSVSGCQQGSLISM